MGFCEDEVVVILGSFFVSVWDSSSMVLEGSIVVFEVVVLVLWTVDETIAQCSCQSGLDIAWFLWARENAIGISSVARAKLTWLKKIKSKRQFKFFLREPMLMLERRVGIHSSGTSKCLRFCARRCHRSGTQ